jgi:hypothetical protein
VIQALRGVDHALVGVRGLADARRAWRRLGFTLSPRGRHIGWGTANHCIMFARDYVELLGIIDPGQFTNDLDRFLAVREGLLGLALACNDAAAAAAELAAAGLPADGPKALRRSLELPEGEAMPTFSLVHLPASVTPGLSAFICQHLSRGLVWREAWQSHPNGACGIRGLTAVVADPGAMAGAYGALFGPARVSRTDGCLQVDSGTAVLCFVTEEALRRLHPRAAELPSIPESGLVALTVATRDLAETAACLTGAGVAHGWDDRRRILVSPLEATGVVLEFVAE